MKSRDSANTVALVVLAVTSFMRGSTVADVLRYCALGYFFIYWATGIREGYRRRRPRWTRESWRRYAIACSIPAVALLLLVGVIFALELNLSMMGARRSGLRGLWILATLFLFLLGPVSALIVAGWLTDGDPARQFTWPRWLRRMPSRS